VGLDFTAEDKQDMKALQVRSSGGFEVNNGFTVAE
jgi:hypothetical protein